MSARINSLEFAHFYQEADDIQKVCEKYNLDEKKVRNKASSLRIKGFNMKKFPGNHGGGRPKTDWEKASEDFNAKYGNI